MSNSQGSHRAARGGRRATRTAEPPAAVREDPGPGSFDTYDSDTYDSDAYDSDAYAPDSYTPGTYDPDPDTYAPAYELREPLLPRQNPGADAPPPAPQPAAYADPPPAPHPDPQDPPHSAAPDVPAPGRAGGGRRRKPGRGAAGGGIGGGPDGLRRLVPQALVVAFLAGGTSAFVANDKAVKLSVDGVPRTMHTFADDVSELLADEGVGIGAHDIVAPAPGTALASGDEVVVRYGRPVTLTLDGQRRRVWTTARTVEGALRQLGVRAEGAYLSASRSSAIGRTGLTLDVRTERTVTFMADGHERTVRTNAATVREAVEEAGITLGGQDTTSVPPDSFPRDGQTVTVMRITGTEEIREEPIAYRVRRTDDPTLFTGTEVVEQSGREGSRKVTYAVRTVNGVKQKPKRISDEVVREPVERIVKVGTKKMPTSVAGADNLDWSSLAHCESGGRPGAVDPSGNYGGLYQFDRQTWQSLGGSGSPQDAPAAEQTFRAKKLYVSRGASPWPHCGRRLYG
ncbi:ubiquitin-like domain-containing protein [Streptomyces sp. NPDC050504]|uniref:ubiquitin-like domain-containing protein n=1 Tax=Streptomyces sp. NPDC050504 TaxID=3365618 RepID=UPI00379AA82D